MCPLLVLPLRMAFLQQLQIVQTRKTKQAVHATHQSIFLMMSMVLPSIGLNKSTQGSVLPKLHFL
jgi:hypothetical protein